MKLGGAAAPTEEAGNPSTSGIKDLLKKKAEEASAKEAESQAKREDKDGAAKIHIQFSPDNLICSILVPVPTVDAPEPTEADILAFLKSYGVIHGVNANSIKMISTFKAYGAYREVAVGMPAVNGKNATIEFFFDTNPSLAPLHLPNGMVNYKELGLLQNVRKNEVLAKISLETDGVSGKDVFGNVIQAQPGKSLASPLGKNTQINKEGTLITASQSGHVSYSSNKISIMDTYEHFGDVGIKSGNVDFVGNLVIKGDVRDGFSVRCERELVVHGNVEGAKIEVDGTCTINGGVNGKNYGSITCGGDFYAKFIENMTVVSGKSVTTSSIMNSTVEASGDINCVIRPGVVVGGNLSAGGNVAVLSVGTPNTTNLTEISIGVPPSLMRQRKEIKGQIEVMKNELVEITKTATYFGDLLKSGKLPAEKKELASSITLTQGKKKLRIIKLEKDLQTLETEILASKYGQLSVYYTINRPTKITINSITKMIDEPVAKLRFFSDQGLICSDTALPPMK